jgi:DNA-binding NarL/FixJ family response regulator
MLPHRAAMSDADEPRPPGLFARWLSGLLGHDPPLPPDTPAGLRVWRRVWPWIPVVLLLAVPAGALVIHLQAGRRAVDLAEKSSISLDQGDYRMAFLQAESAHRLRASDPQVARARASALTAVRDPRAVEAWSRIAERGTMTPGERRARAEAAVQLAGEEEFARLVGSLESSGRNAEAFRWLGWRARLRSDRPAAEDHLRRALELEPTDERRLDLARLLAEAGEPGGQAQAAALVEAAGTGAEGHALLAFGLETLPAAGAATRLAWARRAFLHPSPDNPALLPAATALLAEGHETPAALAAQLSAVFRGLPPAERAGFARWLAGRGMTAEALAFATQDDARTCRSAFMARADALSMDGDWAGLLQLVETPSPAGEVAVAVLRARAERGLGRGGAAELSARRALTLAAPRGQLPETLAQLDAEGQSAVADAVLLDFCGDPRLADLALRVARWRFGQRGEPRRSDEALRRAASVSPQSPTVLDLQRRGRLLAGEAVDPAETLAAWAAEPANLELKLTHGLALLRAGRAAEARTLVAPVEPAASTLPAGQKSIVAAVLAANGARDSAMNLVRTASPGLLSAGEYALVHELVIPPGETH